jgi:ubiquinone/menaquinone biosynthesis C-methylase UbiE
MKKKDTGDFDRFASAYRDIHTKNIGSISGEGSFYFSELKIKELLKYEKDLNLKILDFGCGDGVGEVFLEKHFPRFKITGIDISEESIKKAREKQLVNSVFQEYDGRQLPYEDSSFDIVYTACVFHHIAQDQQQVMMNEIYRVLKRGGRFYFFEHNPYNPVTMHLVKTCEFDVGVKLIVPGKAKKLLRQAGFFKNIINYIVFFSRHRVFLPFLFLEKYFTRFPLGGQYYFRSVK